MPRVPVRLRRRSERSDHPALFCRVPFTDVMVTPNGDVYPSCCPDWVEFPLGNLLDQPWDAIWNGPAAKKLRRSALDGDLRHCDHSWCPHIAGAVAGRPDHHVAPLADAARLALPPEALAGQVHLATPPAYVAMNHDDSCNLACPTCRVEIRSVTGPAAAQVESVQVTVEREVLPGARGFGTSGTGDPFASRAHREFLVRFRREDHPSVERVVLCTNAIMFTEAKWRRMPGLHDLSLTVDISIDAASRSTYEVVRRPARWDRLMENIHFVAGLPNLDELIVNMTVSKMNIHEVLGFYELAESLLPSVGDAALTVEFKRVRRWEQSDSVWEGQRIDNLSAGGRGALVAQFQEIDRRRRARPTRLQLRSNLDDIVSSA